MMEGMNREELRAVQAPLKERYENEPEAALVTLAATGTLEALAACAGVTLRAVATSLGIEVGGGAVRAEGDLDFRGTLAVDREAPVGFRAIRLEFELEASEEELATLLKLTERYCVVLQTIAGSPELSASIARS